MPFATATMMTTSDNLPGATDEKPWWEGVPTKLIRKTTLVEEGEDRLPVHTLTFAIPKGEHHFTGKARPHTDIRLDMGDVVKMVIPGYKPKSYSMSALRQEEGEFDVTVKVYPNGRASGYLDRLKVGDEIGSFGIVKNRSRNPGKYVGIICFGVGITEGIPVARAECEKGDAEKVVLLWASRTSADTFWHQELQQLKQRFPEKFELVNILSREKNENCLHGRINPSILQQVFSFKDPNEARFLCVGTKEMMKQTDNMLMEIGYQIPQNQLLHSGKNKD